MTNNSIFTRVLALMICLVMLVGGLTACFSEVDPENQVGTTTTTNGGVATTTKPTTTTPTTTTTTTGNVVEDEPIEDPVDPNVIFSASTDILSDGLIYGTLASDVVIGGAEIGALVPADVKVESGASSLALSVKKVEDETFGEALSNLDVHINGVATDNTVPMIVKLGAILEAGLGATELKLYHTENGVDNLMTRVNSPSDFAIHNQYYYNAETGEVTIYVASFSVFTAVKSTADVWDGKSDTTWYNETDKEFTLTSAEQLAGFRDLVDAGNTFEGKTVKLGVDIDLYLEQKDDQGNTIKDGEVPALVSFDPIGQGYVHNGGQAFMGTFDGQGHTIYNLYQNGWDLNYSYSTVGGGLFASIKDATIQSLAISGANIVMECIDMGTVVGYAQGKCTFINIVVTDSKLANYQRYTGGVVGEVCKGDDVDDKEYTHIFTNVTVDSSVKISSLWGDFDNACGGVIGGKWGTARVLMQNVTVACEIDAFSDVTAAYQWYAYRRCGMLIGHTEQNSPKSALNAAAEFLTCENVNVYYGDWVNYTYYQFAEQTDEAGTRLWNSNYPWVRAEAGEYNGAFSNVRYGNPVVGGKAINTIELAEANKTGYAAITFNQLYGGGQGVYGTNDHEGRGVTIHNSLTKTVYIQNNLNWNNLTLYYWFANGTDRWTTLVEGINMTQVATGIYKVDVPAYAQGFKVTGTLPNNSAVFSTPEILLSEVEDKTTYPLTAFNLTLTIGESRFDVVTGNWLYNTQVNKESTPYAVNYDVIIYDKNYTGTFTTNDYGVALVIGADGKLVKGYAWDGYYTVEGKVDIHYATVDYATTAFNELQSGETLIIFPNDGTNADDSPRTFAKNICNNWETTMGKPLTLTTTVNTSVHICSNVCTTCFGCRNTSCEDEKCKNNRCDCLDIYVDINIDGVSNTLVVTGNNWLYNTQINTNNYPYASHYQVVIYDSSYDFASAPFTTNEFGIAVVLDADNKIVKIYDAANGDRSVVYYDANGSEVIIPAGEKGNGNETYATRAWSDLEEGEKLAIFPNHKSDNSARNWAKKLCENWANGISGATAIITATFTLPTTIYFQNTQNWANVGIKYWTEDGTELTGVLAKTANDGLHDVYRVVLPANVVKVAFGSADAEETVTVSTPEITSLHNGYIYVVNGQTVNSTLYKEGYKTVYFYNNANWTNVSLYYWCVDSKGETWDTLGFPGEKLTSTMKDGNYDIYKFVLPSYVTSFIISNGTNAGVSGHKQTVDISISDCDGNIYDVGDVDNGTTYKVGSSTYAEGYKTVYLKNYYKWDNVQAYYNIGASWVQAITVTLLGYDGTYEYYSVQIPNFAVKFNISGEKNDGSGSRQQIQDQKLSDFTTNNMVTPSSGDGSNVTVTKGTYSNNAKPNNYKQLYFTPSSSWYTDSARFAVYAFKDGSGNAWYSLTDKYSGGVYKVWVSTTYNEIILCRMNPAYSNNSWDNGHVWNQTVDLTIPTDGKNCFTQNSGWSDNGTWSKK
ncbi:MAG: starch-binding protein [Clostridia bacterium]|nr:starch-binding protein [Clostridia bacterium]